MKKPGIVIATWFAIIFTFALILTSCGSGYVTCDAYGDSRLNNHVLENDKI